jgi:glycosyltransferase involved in cell wall biosynthesis
VVAYSKINFQNDFGRRNNLSRILHLIASNSVGGPEKQLLHHTRDTRNAGYQIVLGSFQDDLEQPQVLTIARRYGIETVSIPGGIRPGLVDDLTEYLRQHRIDLLCTHGYKANVVGHFAAKHAGIPWVPFVHGFTAETWQVTLYERLERSLLTRSPWVVCTSPAQARELGRQRRGRHAPLVIQNAVLAPRESVGTHDIMPTREELGFTRRAFVFGAAGRFSREKGHRFLLDAFAQLQRMLPGQPVELLLLGEGREESALRTQARRLGIDSRVCFAGFQPKPAAWMNLMDCLVQPSLAEGMPNSVLEAMMLGVPVIATTVGGVPEVIENGRTGLLVEPGSANPLAEVMKRLVRSTTLCLQLATEARKHVEENFSPVHQRSLFEMLYRTLLGHSFAREVEEPIHVVA